MEQNGSGDIDIDEVSCIPTEVLRGFRASDFPTWPVAGCCMQLRDIAEDLGEPLSDIELQYLTKEFDSDQRCVFFSEYVQLPSFGGFAHSVDDPDTDSAALSAGPSSSRGGSSRFSCLV